MDIKQLEKCIDKIGKEVASSELFKGFFGSIQLNYADGEYVNSNIHWTTKPERKKCRYTMISKQKDSDSK